MKPSSLHPSTAMMSYGYEPFWSEGSVKCPIFQTSTFSFHSAEEGKIFFEQAYQSANQAGPCGLIYSRLNNPNLEIVEERLRLWDDAPAAAVFNSGMAAISTCCITFLRPGELLVFSKPLYGGTYHFFENILPAMGIKTLGFMPMDHPEDFLSRHHLLPHQVNMLFIETPANPTNALIDIAAWRTVFPPDCTKLVVDNTLMGPLWQHPITLGADLVIYSATKFIGGHSDVIAGSISGNLSDIHLLKTYRTFLGNMLSPFECWLLMRSLETLEVRMTRQAENAQKIAEFLRRHPAVKHIYYFNPLDLEVKEANIFRQQCTNPGSMLSFELFGGEPAAFSFLNALKIIKLAVSLGSTESLAQHPFTMTHASLPESEKIALNITPGLVRLSTGLEYAPDIIADLDQALKKVTSQVRASTLEAVSV